MIGENIINQGIMSIVDEGVSSPSLGEARFIMEKIMELNVSPNHKFWKF